MLFNPLGKGSEIEINAKGAKKVYEIGTTEVADNKVKMSAQSFAMLEF